MELARQIRTDYTKAALDPTTRALLDYAVKVTREPWTCTREDIERLRALGLRDEEILDAVQVIGIFNHFDRVADALGITLNPGYYEMKVKPGVL